MRTPLLSPTAPRARSTFSRRLGEGALAGRAVDRGAQDGERRQLALRRLLNLVETATSAAGATANLYSESFPSRTANPSEFFSRLYFAARGEGVSQETMRKLEAQTGAWLKNWSPVDAQKIDSISVGRTRYAYDARRQVRPAGEYEFALRTPPRPALSLRVTQWEQTLRWPALVWMKLMLGVESDDESGSAWAIATGQWVHEWLAESVKMDADEFVPISEVEEIRARILQTARRFLAETQSLCAKCGRPLPDWWTSGWSNALYIADCLAAKLSGLNDWTYLTTERPLDSPMTVSLGDNAALRLRGRIDLILARGERTDSPIAYPDLWVVDYKTGRQRGFNLWELKRSESQEEKLRKQLVKGRGVQLGLYALAAHALGARYGQHKVGMGAHSDITVLSFHPVKIITTGEGGMVLTQKPKLFERLSLLRSHGITRDPVCMSKETEGPWYAEQLELGYNYRMTDIQAALGASQMRRIDQFHRQILERRLTTSRSRERNVGAESFRQRVWIDPHLRDLAIRSCPREKGALATVDENVQHRVFEGGIQGMTVRFPVAIG